MKKTVLLLIAALLIIPTTSEAGKRKKSNAGGSSGCDLESLLVELPVENLSPKEKESLFFMREEEKLARDVYLSLYEEWDLRVFRNIAKAESKHMASTLVLIDKYELADPVGENALGVFTNPQLQTMYEDLSALGASSLESALLVGAAIEDVDIFDLQRSLGATNNEDLEVLYQNLMMGSRNHLRAFTKVLDRSGAAYDPVYLTQDEYDEIISSPTERGLVGADGGLICGGSDRGKRNGDGKGDGDGDGDCDGSGDGDCDGSGNDDDSDRGKGNGNGDGDCDGSGDGDCDGSGNEDGSGRGKRNGNGWGNDDDSDDGDGS